MKTALISIGNELLSGETTDHNFAFIGKHLSKINLEVKIHFTIPDLEETIIEYLNTISQNHDLIICTGGLGPTKDDITKKSIAKFLGTNLIKEPKLAEFIRERYNKKNINIEDQSIIPIGAKYFLNNYGTAPGLLIEKNNCKLIFLPGVPTEMRNMFTLQILPYLQEKFLPGSISKLIKNKLYFYNLTETTLNKSLVNLQHQYPECKFHFGIYPDNGIIKVVIITSSQEENNFIKDKLKSKIPKIYGGVNHLEIAIVCRSAYGDLILTMPSLFYLKEKYPDSKITYIVDTKNYDIIPFFPEIDHTIVIKSNGNKYINMLKIAFNYRKKFSLVFYAKPEPSRLHNAFITVLGAPKNYISKDNSWYNNSEKFLHNSHYALQLLKIIKYQDNYIPKILYPRLRITEEQYNKDHKIVDQKLEKFKTCPSSNYRILQVIVTNNKPWGSIDLQKYADIINAFSKKNPTPYNIVITYLAKDKTRAENLSKLLTAPNIIFDTQNIAHLLLLIDKVDLLLHAEGGIAHMAAALHKPQIILSAQVNLNVWQALTDQSIVLFDSQHVNNIPNCKIIKHLIELSC